MPPFKPKSKREKEQANNLCYCPGKNSFVHIAWGLSVIKMLLLDPGTDSAISYSHE